MHKKRKTSGVNERRLNHGCAQQSKSRLGWACAFRSKAGDVRHLTDRRELSTTRFDAEEWIW